jgi:hypothetical protein
MCDQDRSSSRGLSYRPRVSFFNFPQLSGMQIHWRVGLALAVGDPEESQSQMRTKQR